MELREPPRPPDRSAADVLSRWLLVLILILLLGLGVAFLRRPGPGKSDMAAAERNREIAAKLQAAGALDEAALLYASYLDSASVPADQRARIAFSLGSNYMQNGSYERALRWFYEAETLGMEELGDELSSRIVHCLERLGRHHAAQAALESHVQLEPDTTKHSDADPVVARIGQTEIRLSELNRFLDGLPPELVGRLSTPEGKRELLERYVADELLWRKAVKLEYDRDPEVERRHAQALKQLVISRFVEQEVMGKIEVDEADLRNYFEANQDRYAVAGTQEGEQRVPAFEEVQPQVERDYRLLKVQVAYDELIDSELAAQEVQLFPERLDDGA